MLDTAQLTLDSVDQSLLVRNKFLTTNPRLTASVSHCRIGIPYQLINSTRPHHPHHPHPHRHHRHYALRLQYAREPRRLVIIHTSPPLRPSLWPCMTRSTLVRVHRVASGDQDSI